MRALCSDLDIKLFYYKHPRCVRVALESLAAHDSDVQGNIDSQSFVSRRAFKSNYKSLNKYVSQETGE